MMRRLTRSEKIIAYTSLGLVLLFTVLGVFAIWVIISER